MSVEEISPAGSMAVAPRSSCAYGRLVPQAQTQIHGSFTSGVLLSEKLLNEGKVDVVPSFLTAVPFCQLCKFEEKAWYTFTVKDGTENKTIHTCGRCCKREDYDAASAETLKDILNPMLLRGVSEKAKITIQNHLRKKGDIFPGRVVIERDCDSDIHVRDPIILIGKQEVKATRTAVKVDGDNVFVTFYYDFEKGCSPTCQSFLPKNDVLEKIALKKYSSQRSGHVQEQLAKLKRNIQQNENSAALFSTKSYLGEPTPDGKLKGKFYQVPLHKSHIILEEEKGSLVPNQSFIITAKCRLEWKDKMGKARVKDVVFTNTNPTLVRAHQFRLKVCSPLFQLPFCNLASEVAKDVSSGRMKSATKPDAKRGRDELSAGSPEEGRKKIRRVFQSQGEEREENQRFSKNNASIAHMQVKIDELQQKNDELERKYTIALQEIERLKPFEAMLTQ